MNAICEDTLPAEYIQGFVKQCADLRLDAHETEALFRVHANNVLLSDPDIMSGFTAGIETCKGVRKSAMLRYLTPEALALSVDCQIKYGSDPLSQEIRQIAGLPEPSWDTVEPHIKAAAAILEEMDKSGAFSPGPIEQFDQLPLQQKVLLASLFGATLGGASRAAAPKMEDQLNQRGVVNRFTRGALRGGLTGAGAAAGETAGSALGEPAGGEGKLLGMTGGSILGGIGGHAALNI